MLASVTPPFFSPLKYTLGTVVSPASLSSGMKSVKLVHSLHDANADVTFGRGEALPSFGTSAWSSSGRLPLYMGPAKTTIAAVAYEPGTWMHDRSVQLTQATTFVVTLRSRRCWASASANT